MSFQLKPTWPAPSLVESFYPLERLSAYLQIETLFHRSLGSLLSAREVLKPSSLKLSHQHVVLLLVVTIALGLLLGLLFFLRGNQLKAPVESPVKVFVEAPGIGDEERLEDGTLLSSFRTPPLSEERNPDEMTPFDSPFAQGIFEEELATSTEEWV